MGIKTYTGAIFDMDGLLFDTERVYQRTWRALAEERGIVLEDGFTETISGTNGATMRRIVERYYRVSDGGPIISECMRRVRESLARAVPVKAGAPEILAYFRGRGLRLAVASSSPREQIVSNLTLSGLRSCFDAVVSGEDVSVGKPAPDAFLCAARALGCAPEQCFVFEDSLSGVKAGHAAGCDVIMVPDLIRPTPDVAPLCFRISSSLIEALREVRGALEEPGDRG